MDHDGFAEAERDAKVVLEALKTKEDSSRVPPSLWRNTEGHKPGDYETVLRVFQRALIKMMSEVDTPLCRIWFNPTRVAIMNCVADCDEWLGLKTCHRALLRGFGTHVPLGEIVSCWASKRPHFLCPPEAMGRIVQDVKQDVFWKTDKAPTIRVNPSPLVSKERYMVAAALASRDDGADIVENHLLRKIPMTRELGIVRHDPFGEYGHRGVHRIVERAEHRRRVDVIIKKEAWCREFSKLY